MRLGPGVGYDLGGEALDRGTIVQVVGRNEAVTWVHIENSHLWVNASYLTPLEIFFACPLHQADFKVRPHHVEF